MTIADDPLWRRRLAGTARYQFYVDFAAPIIDIPVNLLNPFAQKAGFTIKSVVMFGTRPEYFRHGYRISGRGLGLSEGARKIHPNRCQWMC